MLVAYKKKYFAGAVADATSDGGGIMYAKLKGAFAN
jgi:hypothetical protein